MACEGDRKGDGILRMMRVNGAEKKIGNHIHAYIYEEVSSTHGALPLAKFISERADGVRKE